MFRSFATGGGSVLRATPLVQLLWLIPFLLLVLNGCSVKQPEALYSQPTNNSKFWIGDIGPIGTRSKENRQYPFICMTYKNDLGQSIIDNQEGRGNAVFKEMLFGPWIFGEPIGYSENCSVRTRVDYFYFSSKEQIFKPLKDRNDFPPDVDRITLDGEEIDFIVRVERGTINRFLYSIAMLAPFEESLQSPRTLNKSAWNGKLVYKFQGGIGVGHWQGDLALDKGQALHHSALSRGYAVAFSTGTSTGTHYNLSLAEETAVMLKKHFVDTYGEPTYTIGIGGSGGAIQQYVIAQNNKDFFDGLIPQLSYPDMVTQTIYVADCDLLERYFDAEYQRDPNSKWSDWKMRSLVEGLSASSESVTPSNKQNPYAPTPGASLCSVGWRGKAQLVMNPELAHPAYQKALKLFRYTENVRNGVKWTHWNDVQEAYPQDENGVAFNTWDNIGVQYGLRALKEEQITVDEFLDLNACVGGWKSSSDMKLGSYPWNPKADKANPDPWDKSNMNLSDSCKSGEPAPRTAVNPEAIQAAQKSGQVFDGDVDLPILDIRWYLEPILDIHHSLGSFSARARIEEQKGHADNHVVWVAECNELDQEKLKRRCHYDPTGDALDVMDQWLIEGRPDRAVDACMDGQGNVLHAGSGVWDGINNDKPKAECLQNFPVYSTPRIVAGEDITGDLFKCDLKPVTTALNDGTYGELVFDEQQAKRLQKIFSMGVCAY